MIALATSVSPSWPEQPGGEQQHGIAELVPSELAAVAVVDDAAADAVGYAVLPAVYPHNHHDQQDQGGGRWGGLNGVQVSATNYHPQFP